VQRRFRFLSLIVSALVLVLASWLASAGQASAEPADYRIYGGLTRDWISLVAFPPETAVLLDVEAAIVPLVTSALGSAFVPAEQHGVDLVAGTTITVRSSDGLETLAQFTLEVLAMDAVLDVASGQISGISPPGRLVRLNLFGAGGLILALQVEADDLGSWTAEFDAVAAAGATSAQALLEAPGGGTSVYAAAPPPPSAPMIYGGLTRDWISLVGFPPETAVLLDVEAASVPLVTSALGSAFVPAEQHGVDLVAGTTITVRSSDGLETLAQFTLEVLAIDAVLDVGSGRIGGISLPRRLVRVNLFGAGGLILALEAEADDLGSWIAEFDAVAAAGATSAQALLEAPGGGTSVHAAVLPPWPAPVLHASTDRDFIATYNFTPGDLLTAEVRDGPDGNLRWTGSRLVNEGGMASWSAAEHGVDLLPGMEVTVWTGSTAKTLVLVEHHLGVWPGGAVEDLIASGASVGASLILTRIEGAPIAYIYGAPAFVNADFLAIFESGVPAGTEIEAHVVDEDGDASVFRLYSAPPPPSVPSLYVWLPGDRMVGYNFAAGEPVTAEVYDEPGGALLWTGMRTADGWGTVEWVAADHGIDLAAGMQVTMSAGGVAKSVLLVEHHLGVWPGGSIEDLLASGVGVGAVALSATIGGASYTYIYGAPLIVNAAFLAAFESGVPSATAVDAHTLAGDGVVVFRLYSTPPISLVAGSGSRRAEPHPVSLAGNGVLPLILYGGTDLDLADVDRSSLRLRAGGAAVAPFWIGPLIDADRDRANDLRMHFRVGELGIEAASGSVLELSLTGTTVGGTPFEAKVLVLVIGR
jgi:hypothetical protein